MLVEVKLETVCALTEETEAASVCVVCVMFTDTWLLKDDMAALIWDVASERLLACFASRAITATES